MKNRNLLLAFCMLLLAVSCKKENDGLLDSKFYDFDKVIVSDCQMIEKMYGDYIFYEANALFSKKINRLTNPEISSMQTIFQVQDTVVILDHNEGEVGKDPQITKINDYVIGDIQMFIDSIPVPFAKAWVLLLESEIPTPTGKNMTLRNPLSPPFAQYPYYIFSTGGGRHISVYSGDGKVEYFD